MSEQDDQPFFIPDPGFAEPSVDVLASHIEVTGFFPSLPSGYGNTPAGLLASPPMPNKSPILYFIGGPNGAGRTTFAKIFLPAVGVTEFLNADAVAEGLSPLDPSLASIRAARLLLSRWKELMHGRQSFAVESTLSGRTYATMIRAAKAQGYRLHLSYLSLATVQYSIRRVREQMKKGGHDIPIVHLKRRFLPGLHNFFGLYLPLADKAVLYNSTLHPPKLVATWRAGKFELHSPDDYESIRSR